MNLMGKMANQKELERIVVNYCEDPPPPPRGFRPMKGRNRVIRWFWAPFYVLVSIGLIADSVATAQPPPESPFSGESLRHTKITLTVQNQAFSDVLRQLLETVNMGIQGKTGDVSAEPVDRDRPWSLWLDRRVDPSQTVDVTVDATPAAKVIVDVLEPISLTAYPLPGVLLVGRSEWVESTLACLPTPPIAKNRADAKQADQRELISIAWPSGTTAAEVLAMAVLNQSNVDSKKTPDWLPHDVWGGGRLIRVDPTLASALILAQFDLRLRRTNSLLPLLTRSLDAGSSGVEVTGAAVRSDASQTPVGLPSTVTRWAEDEQKDPFANFEFNQSYPAGEAALAVRQAIQRNQLKASVRSSNNALNIRTTAKSHLILLKTLWSIVPENLSRRKPSDSEPVFDLKLVNKPVGEVLKQVAASAGKTIRFEPGTELATERLVTLDAVKKTLHQLAQEVAGQVGLDVNWEDEQVIVTRP
ncbi:hypothetical protein [Neorhodopirellula pilleata]|uniref:Uncharacterized protein n=1 Tax=Neorhodopirellula pilleata TaxID=2714738 RepID=A0A5C6AU74_9BACT|nr:hypothetical protein [Neorhodopirellula pilleata]TWU03545.1 hypothetical protein Pla100_04720 [Neorhodopirellula pilleata]